MIGGSSSLDSIKKWIAIYFWLLIFEGALRKWILPGLATPLLIIRDPIVIYIYFLAFQKKAYPKTIWIEIPLFLAVLSSFFSMILGHQNLTVILFGLRANFLHIPFIFIMGSVLNRNDVEKFLRYIVYLILPMTVLLVIQFYSPDSAFVNVGVGGEGTAGFAGAMGKMRPPTMFSFVTGTAQFYTLASAALLWTPFMIKKVPKIIMIICAGCLILAMPMSISRLLFFSVLVVFVGFIFAMINTSRYRKYMGRFVLIAVIFIFAFPHIPFIDEATETFLTRVENASSGRSKGTFERVLSDSLEPIHIIQEAPLFGYGIGMGTNAGSRLLSGKVTYLIAEEEWGRVTGEMGILGLFYILYRVLLAGRLLRDSWKATAMGFMLPWLITCASFILIFRGQWGQPTTLGFASFSAGLALASLNHLNSHTTETR